MNCKKCKREIPEESIYCMWCGKKQKRDSVKHEKRPNGAGSVYKLSGKRKKPWAVVFNGKYIGYYESRTEAVIEAGRISAENVTDQYNNTVEDIYNAWQKNHFKNISSWGEQGYRTAWTYLDGIKAIKMRDIKTDTLQTVIDDAVKKGKSRAICEKIRNLASQLCKYAMQQDIINKNYAQFLVLPKQEKKEKEIFTDDEINILFAHKGDRAVKIILAMIYTGFRIDELFSLETADVHIDDNYLVGGEKSEAGIRRIVPINKKIFDFIKEWYEEAVSKKYKYLLANTQGNKINPNNFRNREFYKVLGDLGFQPHVDKEHPAKKVARLTPHSTRHTFASLAVRAGVEPKVLQALIGHAHYSTTADVYIHENMGQLQSGMAKM